MIIITGGSGFIGSVLVKELNNKGMTDIVIVDRSREGKQGKNLEGLKYSDYLDADEFIKDDSLMSKAKGIYHMGACSSTTEMDVEYLRKNNIEYTETLFKACAKYKVPLVYASSAATYGDGELGYSDDHSVIPQFKPLNPYGHSKQLFDIWALKQKETPPLWYGIKFFNVFGPQEYHKGSMSSVVFHAFNQIKETGKVKLFKSHREGIADGEQKRDFVYVKDVCQAMMKLIEIKDGRFNGIYNMGTGQARTFKDLVTATFSALGKETNIEYIDMPEHLQGKYQYYTQAEMGKLNKALPDFKFKTLEEGVKDYVQNHLDTENPYL